MLNEAMSVTMETKVNEQISNCIKCCGLESKDESKWNKSKHYDIPPIL